MKKYNILILLSFVFLNGCSAMKEFHEKMVKEMEEQIHEDDNKAIKYQHEKHSKLHENCQNIDEFISSKNLNDKNYSIKEFEKYKKSLADYPKYLEDEVHRCHGKYPRERCGLENKYDESSIKYIKEKDTWISDMKACCDKLDKIDTASHIDKLYKNLHSDIKKSYNDKDYEKTIELSNNILEYYGWIKLKDFDKKLCNSLEYGSLASAKARDLNVEKVKSKKITFKNQDEMNDFKKNLEENYTPSWIITRECYSYFLDDKKAKYINDLCVKHKDCMNGQQRMNYINNLKTIKSLSDDGFFGY